MPAVDTCTSQAKGLGLSYRNCDKNENDNENENQNTAYGGLLPELASSEKICNFNSLSKVDGASHELLDDTGSAKHDPLKEVQTGDKTSFGTWLILTAPIRN